MAKNKFGNLSPRQILIAIKIKKNITTKDDLKDEIDSMNADSQFTEEMYYKLLSNIDSIFVNS